MQHEYTSPDLPWSERTWTIGSARELRPGSKTIGTIEHGVTADGMQVSNAVHIVLGNEEGPVLYVQGAVHGNEVNPVEVLRQIVHALDPQQLKGALIAVPVVNGPAFTARQRANPLDKEDMNRVWPGRPNGSTSSVMAYNLYQQAIRHANYVVDLHTASSGSLLHVVYGAGDEASRKLAEAFGLEFLLEEAVDEKLKEARFQGKLRNVLNARGVPAITPELGGANRIEPDNVAQGVQGVQNVLKYLGMLPGEVVPPAHPQRTLRGSHLDQITATHGGFWVPQVKGGDYIKEGEIFGHVYTLQTFEIAETIRAPYNGYVLGIPDSPTANFGSGVVNFCRE